MNVPHILVNSFSKISPKATALSLIMLMTASFALPIAARAQSEASPAVVSGVAAATPVSGLSATEKVGPMSLRDVDVGAIIELMQKWTGKIVLRPQAWPANLYTLN
jgi:general secretion pathway protein D